MLRHTIELAPGASLSQIETELKNGIFSSLMPGTSSKNASEVSFISISDDVVQSIVEVLDDKADLLSGGPARILSLCFGNAFRSPLVNSVQLTDIELRSFKPSSPRADRLTDVIFRSRLPEFCFFSVPLFPHLDEDETIALSKLLYDSGVDVLTEPPTGTKFNTTNYKNILTDINDFLKNEDKKAFFFINGTSEISDIINLTNLILELDFEYLAVGFRVCPFSIGLNVIKFLVEQGIPIYGYNLLNVMSQSQAKFSISPTATTSLLRIAGADFMNVGLSTDTIIRSNAADEIVRAARSKRNLWFRPLIPTFTGGITPRRAYELVQRFGANCMLHMKKPVFANGTKPEAVRDSLRAFSESAKLALEGKPLDQELENESSRTKHIRWYERSKK